MFLYKDRWKTKKEIIQGERDKLTALQSINEASTFWLCFRQRHLAIIRFFMALKAKKQIIVKQWAIEAATALLKIHWKRFKNKFRMRSLRNCAKYVFHGVSCHLVHATDVRAGNIMKMYLQARLKQSNFNTLLKRCFHILEKMVLRGRFVHL